MPWPVTSTDAALHSARLRIGKRRGDDLGAGTEIGDRRSGRGRGAETGTRRGRGPDPGTARSASGTKTVEVVTRTPAVTARRRMWVETQG